MSLCLPQKWLKSHLDIEYVHISHFPYKTNHASQWLIVNVICLFMMINRLLLFKIYIMYVIFMCIITRAQLLFN